VGDLHGPNGVAWHVDVGIDHDHDLGPHVGGHGGRQGGARFAGEVLLYRHDDAEGDAARGRDGDLLQGRELLAHALEEARFRQESCFRMWLPVGGSRRGQPHLTVMPKGHTNRSFAPPFGPSAPLSPRS
jgi:hypothetical protein